MQPVERERERREGKMNQEIGHGDQTAGLNRPSNRPDLQPGITGPGQAHRRATGHRITGKSLVYTLSPNRPEARKQTKRFYEVDPLVIHMDNTERAIEIIKVICVLLIGGALIWKVGQALGYW